MNFIQYMKHHLVVFDGAMGTQLQSRFSPVALMPEEYNLTHPDAIRDIHMKYAAAGSKVITTNTFGANSYKMSDSKYSSTQIVTEAVQIVKSIPDVYCALDIGPIGKLLKSNSPSDFDSFYELFAQQVKAGTKAGCDLILIETMTDLYEAKAAVLAAKEHSNLPIACTMTLQKNGRTLTGSDIMTIVSVLESLRVDIIGLNCSFGPEELFPYIESLSSFSSKNLLIQPNAGMPKIENGKTHYHYPPSQFSREMMKIKDLGVNCLGGCCGTTPEHIKSLSQSLSNLSPTPIIDKPYAFVSSGTNTIQIDGITIVGESINPTGKKKLKQAISDLDLSYIRSLARSQADDGADVLDINVGVPGKNEIESMAKVIESVSQEVSLPLQIDSSNPEVIEYALRYYNGKALVNSVNGKHESMATILPLIQKYGGMIIGLTMNEHGIPLSAEERLKIAESLINTSNQYGIPLKDMVIDCLTLTASAQQKHIFETIRALQLIKMHLGVKTCLGISNVSYGLPERELINATFLASALTAGLDLAIINTSSKLSMGIIRSFKVIANQDRDASEFIQAYQINQDNKPAHKDSKILGDDLQSSIIHARTEEGVRIVRKKLLHCTPLELINKDIVPALDEVGRRYEEGDIFLPQLLNSAEATQKIFEVLKQHASPSENNSLDKSIVLATVAGDVHDIGKNIVKMLLENYGFHIIDLGKNVHSSEMLRAIETHQATLVGLSALMTTTVANMVDSIRLIKKHYPHVKVMVGGAVLNKEYATEIKSDYYGKDALEAVTIAKKHFDSIKNEG